MYNEGHRSSHQSKKYASCATRLGPPAYRKSHLNASGPPEARPPNIPYFLTLRPAAAPTGRVVTLKSMVGAAAGWDLQRVRAAAGRNVKE